jgi:L-seryl-tRNA(Ser) seleniumtransferase
VALAPYGDAVALERALRAGDPPVVGRIAEGRLLLDLRSVPARDDPALADAVARALAPGAPVSAIPAPATPGVAIPAPALRS